MAMVTISDPRLPSLSSISPKETETEVSSSPPANGIERVEPGHIGIKLRRPDVKGTNTCIKDVIHCRALRIGALGHGDGCEKTHCEKNGALGRG